MSSTKVQKLMRKTRRSRGRHAEFCVINLTPPADQPIDVHTSEELTAEQRDTFRSLLYDEFPELLQHVNSPPVSRQWDHPIDTNGPMRRQRLNRLSHAERAELNRQLKDGVEAGLIRHNYIEFGSPILFVRKAYGSLRLCIDYRGLYEVTRKAAYPLPRVDDTLDELKDANFYTHLDLASGFWQARVRDHDIHKMAFYTPDGLMEWVAMPFGLCNAPATFQRMMNDILRNFLHKFVTVYLDDVCIYSRTLEEHLEYLRLVLQRFK
jgi:phosphoglycolate phosphatase-like HAD superfamily hydrolase